MLINQTNCLTNQSETNLYLLFMLAEFQFHAREYSHFLVFFLSGSCCKNIWHDSSYSVYLLSVVGFFPNIHTCPLFYTR